MRCQTLLQNLDTKHCLRAVLLILLGGQVAFSLRALELLLLASKLGVLFVQSRLDDIRSLHQTRFKGVETSLADLEGLVFGQTASCQQLLPRRTYALFGLHEFQRT